jgi:hypothetical protein
MHHQLNRVSRIGFEPDEMINGGRLDYETDPGG